MKLLSVKEYADAAGVSRAAINSRASTGTISFVRRGIFNFIDIDKYPVMKGKRGRPTAADMLLRRKKPIPKTMPNKSIL